MPTHANGVVAEVSTEEGEAPLATETAPPAMSAPSVRRMKDGLSPSAVGLYGKGGDSAGNWPDFPEHLEEYHARQEEYRQASHRQNFAREVARFERGERRVAPVFRALPPMDPPRPPKVKDPIEAEAASAARLQAQVDDGTARKFVPRFFSSSPGAVEAVERGAERVTIKGKGRQLLYPESDAGSKFGPVGMQPDVTVKHVVRHTIDGTLVEKRLVIIGDSRQYEPVTRAVLAQAARYDERLKRWHAGERFGARKIIDGRVEKCADGKYRLVGTIAPEKIDPNLVVDVVGRSVIAKVAGKVPVGKTGKSVTAKKAADLKAVSVRDVVGVIDIEAARIKRAATPMILCNAENAPVRQILAF